MLRPGRPSGLERRRDRNAMPLIAAEADPAPLDISGRRARPLAWDERRVGKGHPLLYLGGHPLLYLGGGGRRLSVLELADRRPHDALRAVLSLARL